MQHQEIISLHPLVNFIIALSIYYLVNIEAVGLFGLEVMIDYGALLQFNSLSNLQN